MSRGKNMIEQKLFFTRNGEYTIWEKINSLNENNLDQIITLINDNNCVESEDFEDVAYKKRYIYTSYKDYEDIRSLLEEEINKYFLSNRIDRCDFNASLYKINLNYTNIDLADRQLQNLKLLNHEYEVKNIITKIFPNKIDSYIDIRLSSLKINDYKDNSNEQIINTEVRIYFKLGLIAMTDYNDYTHNKKVKDLLLTNVYSLLNDEYKNRETYKLSDITLRLLLKKSKKYSSKFKFFIDDYVNVDFNIIENMGTNPLEHSGLRDFYDKHKISLIKICMSSNTDKYITVDGEKGKIGSRSKAIEVKDIDEFINLINEVIKYDYLNFDYKKNIKDVAMRKLRGHTAKKVSYVNDLYHNIEGKIKEYLGEKKDIDTVEFTRNTFFYCLINNKMVNNIGEIKYKLNIESINKLSNWLGIEKYCIEATFDYLVKIAVNNDENLLESFDDYINFMGETNVN